MPDCLWKTKPNDFLDIGRKCKSIAEKARKVSPANRLGEREMTTSQNWLLQSCCTILTQICTESPGQQGCSSKQRRLTKNTFFTDTANSENSVGHPTARQVCLHYKKSCRTEFYSKNLFGFNLGKVTKEYKPYLMLCMKCIAWFSSVQFYTSIQLTAKAVSSSLSSYIDYNQKEVFIFL